jgi:class 3 adenylate cyclase/predicted ATPase
MAEDELRPVTALFADVVGSTALGERLAPEEVKALIGECVSRMSRAVEEFGGTVQAYMGDGICAYFGVPVAHEDDPERAARAALRIIHVVGEYGRDIEAAWGIQEFDVRVGINSGQTAVGLVGAGDPQAVALGDTTNVAARLQSAARPGTVVAGEATANRLTSRFVLEDLGGVTVKGRTEPVPAWRLVGPRVPDRATATAPLVGRDQEASRLAALVEELTAGRGQVLLIAGEAGIGKTRMLVELRALAGDRVTWLEGRCPSYGSQLLFGPFVQMLREWLSLQEGDAEVAVRTRLRARLGAVLADQLDAVLPYLGRLLSVSVDPDAEQELRALPSEELGASIRASYRAWIEALASAAPVIVALDDLHWADPSSRELAEELLELTDRGAVLVVAAFRPDPASEGWRFRLRSLSDYAHRAIDMPIGPLSDDAAEALLGVLLPGALDDDARRTIVRRAEGNPLYLEELLRALVESGGLQERRRTWTLSVTAADQLPPELESLLVARIDRLPPGPRQLAQVAAAIGRTFPVRVLAQAAGRDDVDADLAALLRADIIREVRRFPELECTFRHGLLQEAAVSTLPPARRRALYGRVARTYEELYADSIEDHLVPLAQYHARSEDLGKALEYLLRASVLAVQLHATGQAGELLRRAEKVASRLGDEAAREQVAGRMAELAADKASS